MQETQDQKSVVQTYSLNQVLDPNPTRVSHPAVTTTTYPAVGITHTGVSHPAVSILVLHTYPAVARHHSYGGVSPSGKHPHTLHWLSRTHRCRRRHSNPRKRHRYQRSSESSNRSSTSSSSSSSSSISRSSNSSSSWTSDNNHGRCRKRKRAKR